MLEAVASCCLPEACCSLAKQVLRVGCAQETFMGFFFDSICVRKWRPKMTSLEVLLRFV